MDVSILDDLADDSFTCIDDTTQLAEPIDDSSRRPAQNAPKMQQQHTTSDRINAFYASWQSLLRQLVEALLQYQRSAIGRHSEPCITDPPVCPSPFCECYSQSVVCIYWDHFRKLSIPYCICTPLSERLVCLGLFPTSPTVLRMAVSIDFLEFYFALFERSGDAINATVTALKNTYIQWGFHMVDEQGRPTKDPFRKPLGNAVQWYDVLRVLVMRQVNDALETARQAVQTHHDMIGTDAPPLPHGSSEVSSEAPSLVPGQCASILQQRCPACFGAKLFKRPLTEGGDVMVCCDGNFSHRHLAHVPDSPAFYQPHYFISKQQVDTVRARIDTMRTRPQPYKPKVPDEVVNSCEKGHIAANENKMKMNAQRYDDTGLMALTCRHDIPLFFANIDTPGEQQKYTVALLEHLFSFLPPDATVTVLYDIGCVLDRSLNLYHFLPTTITDSLSWATSVMHTYGHDWACQLVYNPRVREGLGLTDGEGNERLWSQLRKLIAVTRTSARSRRIWLIDRQAHVIAEEHRTQVGEWHKNRLQHGVVGQGSKAEIELAQWTKT